MMHMKLTCAEPNRSTLRLPQSHLHVAGGQVEQGQGAGGHVDQRQ
jgi:predicted DNA-binding protein with PD1-like motif